MQDGTQSLVGGQIGGNLNEYTKEQREKDRANQNRFTALQLAQKHCEGFDAKGVVEFAEVFFNFLQNKQKARYLEISGLFHIILTDFSLR